MINLRNKFTLFNYIIGGKSQIWMNAGDSTKMMQPNIPEEEEVDDEDMGVAETYADYMPTKCMINVYFNISFLHAFRQNS